MKERIAQNIREITIQYSFPRECGTAERIKDMIASKTLSTEPIKKAIEACIKRGMPHITILSVDDEFRPLNKYVREGEATVYRATVTMLARTGEAHKEYEDFQRRDNHFTSANIAIRDLLIEAKERNVR